MPPILSESKVWKKHRPANETRRASDLTPDEQANVKRALQVLMARLGSGRKLAEATNCTLSVIRWWMSAPGKPSAGIALRAARLAGVPFEDLLSGAWPKAGSCPHCGRL
jgi:hypothetical protein